MLRLRAFVLGFAAVVFIISLPGLGRTELSVISTSPSQNDLGVPVSAGIQVTFDAAVDSALIDSSTFVVCGRSTGLQSGTFVYDSTYSEVTYVPDLDFAVGEVVTVTLTGDIASLGGDPLDGSYTWSFTVVVHDGNGLFREDSGYQVAQGPRSMSGADFNVDGFADIVTLHDSVDSISVLLNDGTGAFLPRSSFSSGGTYPASVYAADFDLDGDPDLAIAHYLGDRVTILMNDGFGNFAFHTSVYMWYRYPQSVFAADFNGDGFPDIAAVSSSDELSILHNDGAGYFTRVADRDVAPGAAAVSGADFDGDFDIDLAITSGSSDSVSILLNGGGGYFTPYYRVHVTDGPQALSCMDVDGDNDVDIVTCNVESFEVAVLKNSGGATFNLNAVYPVRIWPRSVFGGDFDGDDDIDLAVANQGGDRLSTLINDGGGTFGSRVDYLAGSGTYAVCGADFDGDGDMDLAAASPGSQSVIVFMNRGAGFQVASSVPGQNGLGVPVDEPLSATFLVDADSATVNDTTFVVSGSLTGLHEGTVTYDIPSKTATFEPLSPFDHGELVTGALTGDVLSERGFDLEGGFSWSFTTRVDPNCSGIFGDRSAYPVGTGPVHVLAADLSGDGHMDLVTTNQGGGTYSVLLNDGLGGFGARTDYFTYSNLPMAAVAVDFDSDLDLDLAIVSFQSNSLATKENVGGGAFEGGTSYNVHGQGPVSVCAADFDGNGGTDLAALSRTTAEITIFLSDESGYDRLDTAYSVGSDPYEMCTADFNGDGYFDLVTANYGAHTVSVLLNDGYCLFAGPEDYAVARKPHSLSCADLDADGDVDIAVGSILTTADEDVSVLLNAGDGTFAAYTGYDAGGDVYSIRAADLDGDYYPDLVAGQSTFDSVAVLVNDGMGAFGAYNRYAAGGGPYSVCAADLDADGDLDVAGALMTSDSVVVLINQSGPRVVSTSPPSNSVGADRRPDIWAQFDTPIDETTVQDSCFRVTGGFSGERYGYVTYDPISYTIEYSLSGNLFHGEVAHVMLTDGIRSPNGVELHGGHVWSFLVEASSTSRGEYPPPSVYPVSHFPGSLFAADLDEDFDIDLASVQSDSDAVWVIENPGNGSYAPGDKFSVGDSPQEVIGADLNGDRLVDLVTTNWWSEDISVLLRTEWGDFAPDSVYAVGGNPLAVCSADLNGDGYLDLAVGHDGLTNVSVLLNAGDGSFIPDSSYSMNSKPFCLVAGDLDGDGDMDLAGSNRYSDDVSVLVNTGAGVFEKGASYGAGDYPFSVIAAELNGDGYLDLVTANAQSCDITVLLNNGDGSFAPDSAYAIGVDVRSVCAADVDGDGDSDLAVAIHTPGEIGVFLNNGDGSFVYDAGYEAGYVLDNLVAADVNGDGAIDLVAPQWSDKVVVLINGGVAGVGRDSGVLPRAFSLSQNRPNPFARSTAIKYALPRDCRVTLSVYNILGQEVCSLVDGDQDAGYKTARWDARNESGEAVASGVYFYRLEAGNFIQTRKLVLLR